LTSYDPLPKKSQTVRSKKPQVFLSDQRGVGGGIEVYWNGNGESNKKERFNSLEDAATFASKKAKAMGTKITISID
jgi:N-acetylmuramoyl-L-alanine amidase